MTEEVTPKRILAVVLMLSALPAISMLASASDPRISWYIALAAGCVLDVVAILFLSFIRLIIWLWEN